MPSKYMIKENFIEIKPFVKPHPPETVEMLAKQITALPGRVAVLCDPHVDQQSKILVAPGKYKGSQDSDTGVVISSGVKTLTVGDRVGFLPMHGLWCQPQEFNWVPDNMEVRIYGVACPYYESLILLEED